MTNSRFVELLNNAYIYRNYSGIEIIILEIEVYEYGSKQEDS